MSAPFPQTGGTGFEGRVALITGAAQGVGEATARLLAQRGVRGLLLTDRNAVLGEAVTRDIGSIATFVQADLADHTAVTTLVPAAEAAFGRLDIVCNIAASTERGTILDTDLALFDRIMAVNLRAPFFLMQAAAHLMRRRGEGGAIVNVSSVNAHGGAPVLSAYSASKAALVNLTRNTANALAWDRIRVNCILPGWVDTPAEHLVMTQHHGAKEDWLDEAEARQPFGRLIKTDELARAIAYLAGPDSGVMTGTSLDFNQAVPGMISERQRLP